MAEQALEAGIITLFCDDLMKFCWPDNKLEPQL